MTQLEFDFGECYVPEYYVGNVLLDTQIDPQYTLRFYNQELTKPVAVLDWTSGVMKYSGDFDQGASILFNWLCDSFKQRLYQEYTKGFNDGIRK